MQTGVISFCDRICFNIKSLETKDDILNIIENKYNIRILEKHWHRLDEKNIEYIRKIPHLACLRSNGNPYYMFFTYYEGTPIIYFIDKKIHPGYQKPRIILGRGKFDESLFSDTILDGEMVKDNNSNWTYLINDIIVYKGNHLNNKSLPDRFQYIIDLFNNHYTSDKPFDVCNYLLKKYAMATQEGTKALIEFSKEVPYTFRGIYYYPFMFKYKPKLLNFDDSVIKSVYRKVKDNLDFQLNSSDTPISTSASTSTPTFTSVSTTKTKDLDLDTKPVTELSDNDKKICWLRKTDYPDVYDVFDEIQGNKLSIAYVPTLMVSKMLRNLFKNATVAMFIPFECVLNTNVNKWLPLNIHSS